MEIDRNSKYLYFRMVAAAVIDNKFYTLFLCIEQYKHIVRSEQYVICTAYLRSGRI